VKGVWCWEDPKLFTLWADYPYFSDSDFTIHAQFGNDRPPLSVCVENPAVGVPFQFVGDPAAQLPSYSRDSSRFGL